MLTETVGVLQSVFKRVGYGGSPTAAERANITPEQGVRKATIKTPRRSAVIGTGIFVPKIGGLTGGIFYPVLYRDGDFFIVLKGCQENVRQHLAECKFC